MNTFHDGASAYLNQPLRTYQQALRDSIDTAIRAKNVKRVAVLLSMLHPHLLTRPR